MSSGSAILQSVNDFFHIELYQSGSITITIQQIALLLVTLVLGLLVSKWGSRALGHRLKKVKTISGSAVQLIQQLLFYIFLVLTLVGSLGIAGIPVTIFTVMGGAFAIGIGLSAQNTINNLLSGLIILFERPVKVGDIVELNGMEGKVEEIGHRVVLVRRVDGVDMLVPSSFFLDQTVVNWTLNDALVRGSVSVGVAYGSDTSLVKSLIDTAVNAHGQILDSPSPEILFTDFGDNALNFKVFFWIKVHAPIDRLRIESDVRFRIDKAFRTAGVVIAFPQRDVHIDFPQPIQVEQVSLTDSKKE